MSFVVPPGRGMPDDSERSLVSIIIPCYNQAHFLRESIESVLAQTHASVEAVVVDDGSTDNTGTVAAQYDAIRCVRQENLGLSAARNFGMRAARGEYIMFLDADDRLMANAVETHLRCFREHPQAGFVVGIIELISEDGSYLRTPRPGSAGPNQYEQLLMADHVANTIAVMFRQSVFEQVGMFNTSVAAAADYEMLLRVARCFPGVHHDDIVAQYRRHTTNMSRNGMLMLRTMHTVLASQRQFVIGNARLEAALRRGEIHWRDWYGAVTIAQVFSDLRHGELLSAIRAIGVLLGYVRGRIAVLPWKFWRQALRALKQRFG